MVSLQDSVSYDCLSSSYPVECVKISDQEMCVEVSTREGLTGKWTIKSHKHLSPVSFAWEKKWSAELFLLLFFLWLHHTQINFPISDQMIADVHFKGIGSSDSNIFKLYPLCDYTRNQHRCWRGSLLHSHEAWSADSSTAYKNMDPKCGVISQLQGGQSRRSQ